MHTAQRPLSSKQKCCAPFRMALNSYFRKFFDFVILEIYQIKKREHLTLIKSIFKQKFMKLYDEQLKNLFF